MLFHVSKTSLLQYSRNPECTWHLFGDDAGKCEKPDPLFFGSFTHVFALVCPVLSRPRRFSRLPSQTATLLSQISSTTASHESPKGMHRESVKSRAQQLAAPNFILMPTYNRYCIHSSVAVGSRLHSPYQLMAGVFCEKWGGNRWCATTEV